MFEYEEQQQQQSRADHLTPRPFTIWRFQKLIMIRENLDRKEKKGKGFCGAKPSQPTGHVVEDGGQEEITKRLYTEQDYSETELRSKFTPAS